ncbi:DUF2460 domain-containing protein [Pseudaminobacter sp. 19-2017]|uniref:DUF2460 domain-containing protein n=1 Tax=Pseudaminobacter soli (ex Zhang et al. 2022) TaxID=2831468 RepID=A0A942E1H6_9HYPH|nr:DUF2460 domain-containing protein [Pseudaminobacter soli]MBS3648870.1 DUF2460 domain-containing protein [Pseudaminobacter soli]
MFHDVRFPEDISYGSKGGPKFSTSVITLASGKERRNINWRLARAEYDVSHGIKDEAQMDDLRDFFYARVGMAYSFRFKDWGDYSAISQEIGKGDGTKKEFFLSKGYQSGNWKYVRPITKPVVETVTQVLVGGLPAAEFTVDGATGKITLPEAPVANAKVVVPYFEFDVHARFDIDHFDPVHEFWLTQTWQSIPVIEIKDED